MHLGPLASFLGRPYALGLAALPDGLSVATSALPARTPIYTTPNAGAGVVGNRAVLYVSLDNLAALLRATGVMRSGMLARLQAQTGIDVAHDLLPLISHEAILDINDERSPVILEAIRALSGGTAAIPAFNLPGSLELALEVDNPAAAQQSLTRLFAALQRLLGRGGGSPGSGPVVRPVTLPDGSTGYVFTALPALGYTFHGNFLIFSTSLRQDVRALQTPLAADPAYTAALAHVAGAGPLVGVGYLSVTRLVRLINALLTTARSVGANVGQGATIAPGFTLQQAEALIAPVRTIVTVARQVGPGDEQVQSFITIR